MPSPPSAYDPIWRALKDNGTSVVLDVVPARVKQLKKAVIDLKYKDKEFRESNPHVHSELIFDLNKSRTRLIIYLVQYPKKRKS